MTLPKTFRKLQAVELVPDFARATRIVEAPLALPGEGQVLVRNRFMGVNGSDPVSVCGGYGVFEVPFDLGLDSGGEVVAVGNGVRSVSPGDQVLVFGFGGGYGEYRLADETSIYPVPRLDADILAAFVPALTASVGLSGTGELHAGETVLVTAAAGGVGSYAVQMAKAAGCHVIGTTGDAAKAQWLVSLGCDRVINYRAEDIDAVLAAEYPQGINLVFETVGRATFDTALRHLAPFGRLLAMGATSEYADGVHWEKVESVRIYQTLMAKSVTLAGLTLAMYPHQTWERHLKRIVDQIAAGTLRVTRDPTRFHGTGAIQDAVSYLEQGCNRGKIIVTLDDA